MVRNVAGGTGDAAFSSRSSGLDLIVSHGRAAMDLEVFETGQIHILILMRVSLQHSLRSHTKW